MSKPLPKVYPSVDWLTMTVGQNDHGDDAYDRAKALLVEQVGTENDLKTWVANGFRGWRAPHIRTGRRNRECIVELSGGLAEKHWREFYPLASNVSRLDTCVTVTFASTTCNIARDGRDAPPTRPRPGFPSIRKVLWEQVDGGQTLYLGSPKSDRFARLYDKSAESRGEWPPNSWRWELQERNGLGSARAGLLDSSDDVHRAIRAGVHGFFTYHGVFPWFHADGPTVFSSAGRTRTDLSRRLHYYERCIAPGVRSGIDRGHGDAILAALKIDDDETLAQLGLVRIVPTRQFTQSVKPVYKGDDACQPASTLEDLTPPKASPESTPSSSAIGSGTAVPRGALGAWKRWPETPRGST